MTDRRGRGPSKIPGFVVMVDPDPNTVQDTGKAAEGPRAVTLLFADRLDKASGSAEIDENSRRLRVKADPNHRVVSVELSDPGGLDASSLQHFAWARWLTVADNAIRTYGLTRDTTKVDSTPEYARLSSASDRALAGTRFRQKVLNPKRPGRAAHPDSHYRQVAEEYEALCRQGSRRPTKDLADCRHVSRSTAAGWVRVAREREFLPPARGNRPAD